MKKGTKVPKRYFVSLDFPRTVVPRKSAKKSTVRENRTANTPPADSTDHHWHERRPPPYPSLF